jgi:hypothetical protein
LPLTNLKDRRLSKVARSTDDALTSTIVKVDLGVARSIRLVAVPKHNLSTAAKARVRLFAALPIVEDNDFNGWTSVGTPVVTTGQVDPFSGTRATLIEDNDGAAEEGKYRVVAFTGDGTKVIALTITQGTATATEFGIYDLTAAGWLHRVLATRVGDALHARADRRWAVASPIHRSWRDCGQYKPTICLWCHHHGGHYWFDTVLRGDGLRLRHAAHCCRLRRR